MAMEITNNYSSYAVQTVTGSGMANSTQKKETDKTSETAGSSKAQSTAEYMSELAKLVPSVECRVGNGFSSAKKGKTLTINPKLLEEMQNDPEKEKEMKELMKGVESISKLMDGIHKASGWRVVYRHSYIDENGKYCQVSCVRNDFMLNLSDKLREERRKNSEKLIEKTKEKVEKKKEELEKKQGLVKGVKPRTKLVGGIRKPGGRSVEYFHSYIDENGTYREISFVKNDKMLNMSDELREERRKNSEKLIERTKERAAKRKKELEEKIAASKDGMIYLNDSDFRSMLEMIKEEKTGIRKRTHKGANLDILL